MVAWRKFDYGFIASFSLEILLKISVFEKKNTVAAVCSKLKPCSSHNIFFVL